MAKPSEGKLLYHITHIKNMPSIFENGLMSRRDLEKWGHDFKDIADPEILSKRKIYSSYVLFHFYAKNPFDGIVCQEYGPEKMVIITIPRKLHETKEFLIIPSHPLDSKEKPKVYPYEEGFNKIHWDILDNESDRDYHKPKIKKACMAECLVESPVTVDMFCYIYVYNDEKKEKLMRKLKKILEDNKVENLKEILDHFDFTIQVAPYMFPKKGGE